MAGTSRKDYMIFGDGKIYYEETGEGMPLILTHAGFVDSRMWDDQWEELGKNCRVIRYDMRGFGKSDPLSGPVSRRDELLGLMEYLEIDEAVLVGCSLSGETVLDVALLHPEAVRMMVLVSTVPGGFELQGEPPRYLFQMLESLQQTNIELTSELQIRIWLDGPYREPGELPEELRNRVKEMNRVALSNRTWAVSDSLQVDALNPPAFHRLEKVLIPTLIIAGELDDPEIRHASDIMAERIPDSLKLTIAGCAHLPNMEKPGIFNRTVLDFLGSRS